MKKILLALFTIPLMAVQCSEEERAEECTCDRVVYKYGIYQFQPDGITPIWSYREESRTPANGLTCDDATGNYLPISGVYYYKIECR